MEPISVKYTHNLTATLAQMLSDYKVLRSYYGIETRKEAVENLYACIQSWHRINSDNYGWESNWEGSLLLQWGLIDWDKARLSREKPLGWKLVVINDYLNTFASWEARFNDEIYFQQNLIEMLNHLKEEILNQAIEKPSVDVIVGDLS